MKKLFVKSMAAALLICLLAACAGARTLYDQYWLPGEYILEVSEERRAVHEELWRQVQELAEGSPVKEANEAETLEAQYEKYLQLGEIPERIYDDVGAYVWAAGLPDDQSVSRDEAYLLACMAAEECFELTTDDLLHVWPKFSYVTADAENPVWEITFLCYDGAVQEDVIWTVAIYAHDGSVCGVRSEKAFG
ncbi:MAG: hypothetical protein IJ157_13400 [Clostridia bacterium]|nr:hypothetical protein [Clostridia bacterium]